MCSSTSLGGTAVAPRLIWHRKSAIDEQAEHPGRDWPTGTIGCMPDMPRHALFGLRILGHGIGLMPFTIEPAQNRPPERYAKPSIHHRNRLIFLRKTAELASSPPPHTPGEGLPMQNGPRFRGPLLISSKDRLAQRRLISPSVPTRRANAQDGLRTADAQAPLPWADESQTERSTCPGPRPRQAPWSW